MRRRLLSPQALSAGLGALLVVGWAVWFFHHEVSHGTPQMPTAPPQVSEPAEPQTPALTIRRETVERRLAECDRAVREAIRAAEQDVRRLFARARDNVPAFADDAVGLWTLFRYLWYGEEDIARMFEQRVLSSAELESVLMGAVERFAQAQVDAEAELLVQLAADVEVEGGELSVAELEQILEQVKDELRMQYSDALKHVGAVPLDTLKRELVVLLVSDVVEKVVILAAARVAARFGVAAVSSGGAIFTFGTSILVGIAVDWILNWLWDPAGKLSRQLRDMLKEMEQGILAGNAGRPGLVRRLEKIAQQRSEVRRAVVYEALRQMNVEVR